MDKPKPICWSSWAARLFAFGLCIILLGKAWAGVYMYRSDRAMAERRYGVAAMNLQKASFWYRSHPLWHLSYGTALLERAYDDRSPEVAREAGNHIVNALKVLKFSGRAWIHAAEARLLEGDLSGETLGDHALEEVQSMIARGIQQEPNSAWILFKGGSLLLSRIRGLKEKDIAVANEFLQRAVEIDPEEFLKPVLSLIWDIYEDFNFLRRFVPRNARAYEIFMDFMDAKGLWKYRPSAYEAYRTLRVKEYEDLSISGEIYLKEQDARRAFYAFRRAWWIDEHPVRAKLGLLVSEAALGRKSAFDVNAVLGEILEAEDEWATLKGLRPYIKRLVDSSRDPYLQGIHALRSGNFTEAVSKLEQADRGKIRIRLLAKAYSASGQTGKARVLLQSAIERGDNVDLRDLLLLEDISSSSLSAEIEAIVTRRLNRRGWRYKGEVRHDLLPGQKTGAVINLLPGKAVLHMALRTDQDGEGGAFLIFRLGDKVQAVRFIGSRTWDHIPIEIETTGGRRWLNIEYYAGGQEHAAELPMVEIGGLRVKYLSEKE